MHSLLQHRNDKDDTSELINTASSINEKSGEIPSATASTHCINNTILSRTVIMAAILTLFIPRITDN
jgi:hypothetical protein